MTDGKSRALLLAIEQELKRLQTIRGLLAGEPDGGLCSGRGRTGKRNLSAEARQRIIDAQKRRWAAQKATS